VPALFAVVVGILLGYAAGGSLPRLGHLKLRFEWLIIPLFVAQAVARGRVLGMVGASQLSLLVWTLASVVLVAAMLANWTIPGMALGAAGILMNIDVVLVNGTMPVVLGDHAELAGTVSVAEVARSTGSFYRVATPGDLLLSLSDVMPVTWGRSVLLVSPGDVVLMVAVAVVIVYGMMLDREGGGSMLAAG
jgi:hypothetical protein